MQGAFGANFGTNLLPFPDSMNHSMRYILGMLLAEIG
jgi:hypothetical protein